MKHIKLIIALLVVIVASYGVMMLAGTHPGISPNIGTPHPATLTGTITCLPHKGTGPQTMECAFGLQTDDGKYHALHNIPQEELISGEFQTGNRVTVSGSYIEDGAESQYDIAGTLDIEPTEPAPTGSTGEVRLKAGDREGSFEVTAVNADSVDGLNYMEYPVAQMEGAPLTLKIGEMASNGCTVTLTLLRTEGDTAVFKKVEDNSRPCPICLSKGTQIATENGEVAVENLRVGMLVWTIDDNGAKTLAPIARVSKTPVPETHTVVQVTLADGRSVTASPNHPLTTGNMFADLKKGDVLDGAVVTSTATMHYADQYTYDLLPESATGFYFANGIPLASTLK